LTRVEDLMHKGDEIPRVSKDTQMKDVLFEMTRKRLGLTTVVETDGTLLGLISDGDLRRQMERHGYALLDRNAGECMTREPVLVGRDELATRALDLLESRRITALVVTDAKGRVEGVLHLHDLWKTEMV
ncbi:MAG: CBS domain-containing protein, partial [Burkholderiales bacterium]